MKDSFTLGRPVLTGLAFLMMATFMDAQTYQPFPTTSATWKVERCWSFFLPGWHDTYTLTLDGSDTLYQGEVYKRIMISEHLAHGSAFDSIYPPHFFGGLREEDKHIYIFQSWGTVDTTEHLIYDFSHEAVGDTIFTSALFGPAAELYGHLVTAVDSVLVAGTWHKRLTLENPDNAWQTEQWIEGIGSLWGLPFATVWSITDNSYDLTCFYREGHLQYSNPLPQFSFCQGPLPDPGCDPVITEVSRPVPTIGQLGLSPNPAADQVTLKWPTSRSGRAEIRVYSITGQLTVARETDDNWMRIDLASLTNGQYLVLVRTEETLWADRLVVAHP